MDLDVFFSLLRIMSEDNLAMLIKTKTNTADIDVNKIGMCKCLSCCLRYIY